LVFIWTGAMRVENASVPSWLPLPGNALLRENACDGEANIYAVSVFTIIELVMYCKIDCFI